MTSSVQSWPQDGMWGHSKRRNEEIGNGEQGNGENYGRNAPQHDRLSNHCYCVTIINHALDKYVSTIIVWLL